MFPRWARAVALVAGGPAPLYGIALSVGSLLLQVCMPYSRYVKVLKWLCLVLFSYVATAFIIKIPWRTALIYTFIPHWELTPEFLTVIAAIFGTTISPYLFFWQASQEVEEVRINRDVKPLTKDPSHASVHFGRIEMDTRVGMAISNLVAYFIILTAAATLHATNTGELKSAADAAQALKPVAGTFAFVLFSLGIVGTGFLALPVLAGSAAYGLAESLGWRNSLEVKPVRAKRFYFALTAVMLVGTALVFVPIDPIKALVWAAVLNGLIAPPLMATMMMIAANRSLMKSFVLPPRLKAVGWIATATMTAVAALIVGGWFSR
ncbi:MAG: divalent metal cation transporter [Nibricoccus sp.]